MKQHQASILIKALVGCALTATAGAQGPSSSNTTVSGTISQFNYDRDGEVEGFLLNGKTLVQLPPQGAARLALSMHAGDNVQVTGGAQTVAVTGFQTMEAQSVEDRSLGKTFTLPQPGAGTPYSASGRIQQFNYGPDGAINGLVFDNGTLATLPPFSAANPSSLKVGSTVAFTGYARTTVSGPPPGRTEEPPPPPAPPQSL